MTENLMVDLGERSYAIRIGSGILDQAGEQMLPLMSGRRAFIVTDDNVAPLYLTRLQASLDQAGIAHVAHILPAGEGTKNFAHLETLLEAMLAARVERSTMVVALGGGVVGDLTGFAAAICLRGVDFIQIPTTLLAQVDSSVGGKTGINTAKGKNLVGSFHQPRLVLVDTATLDTLTPRHVLAGYGEVVKYGCIDDPEFFGWLEENATRLIAGDDQARRYAIAASCRAKARIVAADEREGGVRALLNLGHTFGHALEAEVGFTDEILHGEAVAMGMIMAYRLSTEMGLSPLADLERLRRHFKSVGLPTTLPTNREWNAEHLLHHMAGDKKVKDGKVTFVLARGIGSSYLTRDVPAEALQSMLTGFVQESRRG